MEAIPVERAAAASAAVETAPERVAPSQAAYARPGLPGEHPKPEVAPAPVEEEEVRLTPEQEILAEIVEAEPEVEEAVAEAVAAEPEPPVRVERPRADRPAAGGLRFAEEIREVQRSEDEDEANRRDRRKRRGGTTPAGPARPARPPRGGTSGRRFDLDDIDEEEIEAALHGDDFLDDEDDDEGDDY